MSLKGVLKHFFKLNVSASNLESCFDYALNWDTGSLYKYCEGDSHLIFTQSCYVRTVWYKICGEDRLCGWEKMGKNWRLYNVICNCICFSGRT